MATALRAGQAAIPQPPPWPVLGNLPEIDRRHPCRASSGCATVWPIYRMQLPGRQAILLSGHNLVNDACDEDRFDKLISTPLRKVRAFTGDGLFTAWTFEPNWPRPTPSCCRISGSAMQGYMPQMVNVAEQLVAKWEPAQSRRRDRRPRAT